MSDIVERLRDPSRGSPRWGDTMDEAADEIDRLREALRQLLTVMPVFPDAAKKIVGMEDRYNSAITNARDALRESDA